MSRKSSDGEVNDGYSSDPDLIEPMETTTGVGLSLLGKRRADETPNSDESGESEQTGDEDGEEYELDEESHRNEKNSEPEWGYDSFEGREYHSSDQKEYSDKEFEEQCRYYRRQLIRTKGFFESSDRFPLCLWGGIGSLHDLEANAGKGLTVREFCANLTSSCLERYNQEQGLNVKLDHILRANYDPGSMSKFYITFAARESDSPDAPLVEYQAKAAWHVADKTYPIFCRPSPPQTMCNSLLEDDGRGQLNER